MRDDGSTQRESIDRGPSSDSDEVDRSTPMILIVDAASPPSSLVGGLTDAGYDVRVAADAESARSLFACNPELALVELHVGEVSGLDLLQEIRARSPATKAMIVTMYGSIESVRLAMSRGAVDYFTKPVTAYEILASSAGRRPAPTTAASQSLPGVQAIRKRYIEEVLAQCGSLAQTSRLLHVERRSLRRMLRRP